MWAFFMSSLLVTCWFFLLTLQALVQDNRKFSGRVFPFQRVVLWIAMESLAFTRFRGLQHNFIFTYQQSLMASTFSLLTTIEHTFVSPSSPLSHWPQLWNGCVLYHSLPETGCCLLLGMPMVNPPEEGFDSTKTSTSIRGFRSITDRY